MCASSSRHLFAVIPGSFSAVGALGYACSARVFVDFALLKVNICLSRQKSYYVLNAAYVAVCPCLSVFRCDGGLSVQKPCAVWKVTPCWPVNS